MTFRTGSVDYNLVYQSGKLNLTKAFHADSL